MTEYDRLLKRYLKFLFGMVLAMLAAMAGIWLDSPWFAAVGFVAFLAWVALNI